MHWLRARGWVATAIVTVVSLLLVGGVIVATTNVGCAPAGKLGLKLARCTATSNTSAQLLQSPTAYPSAKGGFTPQPSAPATTPATFYPPQSSPGSSYPPAYPPGSSGQVPQYPFYGAGSSVPGLPSLSCALPAYAGPPGSGGFVSFPTGSFTADPRSAVSIPSPGPQNGPGYGYAPYGMAFDRAHSRWLPVGPQFVAPDGNHYAFAASSGIYIVDASTGTEVEVGEGHTWTLLRTLNDRVYAVVQGAAGFWVVPFSGSPTEVTTQGYWTIASASAAYGTPTSQVPSGITQQLLRLDIATGGVTNFFSSAGASVAPLAFDTHGNPIVQTSTVGGSWELWVVGSSKATVIANSYENFYLQGGMVPDNHGVWIPMYWQTGAGQGIALYVEGSGIYELSTVGAQIGGPCT